ncbi:MAG: HAMP domain-containing histidine kinase, partial [Candidatus Obscuribacterales bacterium]|nr:HAMP domain-containing histidine kinase [Candidatus Obscuribacterales bacterium]
VGKGSCFWFQIPTLPTGKANNGGQAQANNGGQAQANNGGQAQANNNEQNTIKAAKRGSLKRTFLLMMLVLLIPQSLVILKLHSMFDNTSKRTTSFKNNKEVLLRVEELLSTNLVWKLDIANAIDARRIGDVAKTRPVMKEQLENCNWMLSTLSPKSETYHQIEIVKNGLKKLNKFGDYLSTHEDNLNIAAMPELVKQARNLAKKVEAGLFKAMALQNAGVQKSYDFSVVMRSELIAALGFAAVLNFGLLALTGFVALRITDRISKLKSKAEAFSSGKRLEPSLPGDDELTYLDKRLCEVSQAIKDADSQRQKLIAVINHDLRTPLSSIINGLQMILASGYGEIGEKEKAITTAAEQELEHLLQQINDLLLIEKIDAGLYQLSPEKFEVLPVLAATAKTFDETASQRGVKMVSEISPECAELCVNGDKSLVEREFAIILSNAVNAAPDGSTIDFSVERTGDSIAVKFRDRGTGIDEELLPQIFDRFRFVNGKPVTGLGLPLAQRLSAIHGGSLQINSSAMGTETCVTLPLAI